MRVASLGVLSLVLAGCVGSTTAYKPYKGEPRPPQEVQSDPIRDEVELKHGLSHETTENTHYISETRKAHVEVLEHVHRNSDGTTRNAWNAYASDMNATLGPSAERAAAKVE